VAARKRVLSGMRPTGRLHIGHYFGALENWIRLQNDPEFECFYFIADWHALTTNYADTSQVAQDTIEMAADWLAAGLDPAKCTMFLQSAVPEHAELHLLLSMITPLGWLERVPTYKEALENIKDKDLHTYGFLGYPVLQSADIVLYGEPDHELVVPVGEDQVSHVELTREIVRKFNGYYGLQIADELFEPANRSAFEGLNLMFPTLAGAPQEQFRVFYRQFFRHHAIEVGIRNFLETQGENRRFFVYGETLTEPQPMLTRAPRVPGLDGRKMSKSYGNAITLSESDESIRSRTRVMMTDPARKRRTDPGNPDVCPVFDWHKLFSPPETQAWSAHGCRTAEIGCIECKAAMAENLIKWITPVRERRREYERQPERVAAIIDAGSERARSVARQTMARTREAVFGWRKLGVHPSVAGAPAKNAKVGD
jgi:tryptophanyl-tRNA synthetase